jgi:diguanylate cyclase (GGDEF)-like protein
VGSVWESLSVRGWPGPLRGLGDRARSIRPGVRVWLFSGALAALAGLLYVLLIHSDTARGAPILVPWWLVAAGFFVADVKVIQVHFRRESHAFSLTEVPAVIGLFFLSPMDYLLAVLAGAAAAMIMTSARAPVKIGFNLANYLVLGVLMVAIFRAAGVMDGPPALIEFVAAFGATTASTVVGGVTIATAITLSGGAPQFKKLPEMLEFGILVALANTSIALLAVVLLWFSPAALWLLVIPLVALFLAYRAWVSEREKHERLELVYQSSRILQHSPELDVALVALLDHTRAMFRAELAEVVLDSGGPEHRAVRTSSLQDEPSEVIHAIPAMEVAPPVRQAILDRTAGMVALERTPGGRALPIRQAMVAPLVGEGGVIGLFTVANRLTEGTEFGADDLRLLETVANQAAVALENGQLGQSLAELSRLKEQLRHQAYHDPLTNLPNRLMFIEHATAQIENDRLDGHRPVILLLDLDDFKHVNDTLGHAAGDELLVLVTDRITGCLRADDLAARLGGDEFAILLRDQPTLSRSVAVAERLIETLGAVFMVQGHEVSVGVSVGIAMSRGPRQSADELLSNADVAMYTAKANGRRRFAVFDPSTHAAIIARHELSAQLTRSIASGELTVLYQPIVELASTRTVGLEALVRWRHPVRGLVEPDEFISLAEDNGSIIPLGRFVLEQAMLDIHAWNRVPAAGKAPLFVSVNVSAIQLQQADFLEVVDEALTTSGLEPGQLVLEITESVMFREAQTTITKLQALRDRGIRIAIDDFGTGYSSLSYLRRFPVDILKIAKDFVTLPQDAPQEWAFAGAILALGRQLDLAIIAEGIEQPGQRRRLRELGCDLGQGFLFARPAPIGDVTAALRARPAPGGTAEAAANLLLPPYDTAGATD